jgi:hypothetical protein
MLPFPVLQYTLTTCHQFIPISYSSIVNIYWSGSSSRQLSHLAGALANFRLIFTPSLKDVVLIFIEFHCEISLKSGKNPTASHILS